MIWSLLCPTPFILLFQIVLKLVLLLHLHLHSCITHNLCLMLPPHFFHFPLRQIYLYPLNLMSLVYSELSPSIQLIDWMNLFHLMSTVMHQHLVHFNACICAHCNVGIAIEMRHAALLCGAVHSNETDDI